MRLRLAALILCSSALGIFKAGSHHAIFRLALSLWLFEGGWPLKLIIAICKRLAPKRGYL
jgi:hypothetical protein